MWDTISDSLEENVPMQELTVSEATCSPEDDEKLWNSAEVGLWDTLWLHSKGWSRGTLLVAEEGLRIGEMQ